MEGFTYNNIFDTKGIEYLVIIGFLVLLIPFWVLLNKKANVISHAKKMLGVLSAGILKIPQGLFYSRNHSWTYLEKSGTAKVGLDDLVLHLMGDVKMQYLKNPDDPVRKGELLAEIDQNGKRLRVFSPISGKVVAPNELLTENPALLGEDPYGRGWIYEIRPSNWVAETNSYYFADQATDWLKKELERFKDFVAVKTHEYSPQTAHVTLQDGGELADHLLTELPNEIWQDFQKDFLDPKDTLG
jgi:glycine cleavage system H protein